MSLRSILCPVLLLCVLATGCSSTPKKKTIVYEKTGETVEYSDASDGRDWFQRHPYVEDMAATASVVLVCAVAIAAAVVIYALAYNAADHQLRGK